MVLNSPKAEFVDGGEGSGDGGLATQTSPPTALMIGGAAGFGACSAEPWLFEITP